MRALRQTEHFDAIHRYSIGAWLERERLDDTKYDYHRGQLTDVRAMAGGSRRHGHACTRVSTELDRALEDRRTPCAAFNSEIKIEIKRDLSYKYPDAAVACDIEDGRVADSIANPILVWDVVSPSSFGYDKGDKFELYKSVPSLRY